MMRTLQLDRYVTLVEILCLLSTQAWSASSPWPTEGCTRQSDMLTCTGTIPPQMPQGIREVTMFEITDDEIIKINTEHLFCHTSWSAIETISIFGSKRRPRTHNLYNNMFQCLGNLTSLRLTLPYLYISLPEHTFAGLDKVRTLYMSDCENLSPICFFTGLKDSKNLPNLSKLVLNKMNIINDEKLIFTKEMFQTLSRGRNITQLDLSKTRLSNNCIYNLTEGLCQTLKVLNASGVRVIHDRYPNPRNTSPCYSLETIDLSGVKFAYQAMPENDESIVNVYEEASYNTSPEAIFMENVETLNLSNGASYVKYIYIYNSMLNVSLVYNLKHLESSNNRLKYMDGVLVSEFIRLESLDFSQNGMEYLTPRFFQQRMTTSLRRLDISKNMLWHMESDQTEFGTMFTDLIHLEVLYISHNNFSKIPKCMFEQNTIIHYLDMSNNKLTHVMFDMKHLINLRYFDISGNSFVNLDSNTINVLNHIYSVQLNMTFDHLKVNIHNNPLQCSKCSNLEFSKWVTTSPTIATNHEGYMCETETRAKKPLDSDVVSEIHTICDRSMLLRRTVLLATLIPVAAITMLVITIRYVVKLVREKKNDANVEKIRQQIENNEYEFKYPVFLSYSSLDDDIVLNHLYEDLQHHLRAFCRTDRELVCIGDRHFRAGRWIFDEVSHCLEMSALLVVVMSNNYCHSDWCIDELQQAYQQHKQMLLIFIENVDEEDMHQILRNHFRTRVRVKYCNTAIGDYEIHPEWDTVCPSIIGNLP